MMPPTRILIIEDEEVLAENLRDFLVRRDARVHLVSSAESAIESALPFEPDTVILDYSLPGMNGLEAFSRLRQTYPQLRGILMSGHPADALRDVADLRGIACVLTKPFPFSELDVALGASEPASRSAVSLPDPWAAAPHPSGERRNPDLRPEFPLGTAAGPVLKDRRRPDGHGLAEHPSVELGGFGAATN